MTKLDEIAVDLVGVSDIDDAHAAWWKEEYGDLLIRAVRQFGAEPKAQPHVNQKRVYWDGEQYRPIDPDVLELIESPISVVANEGAENKDR